jgi:hypothetical protein
MSGRGSSSDRRHGHPSGGPGLNQLARSGITPGTQLGHLHDTPWTGGYRTSLAGIGSDGKIQLDGRKWDQFRFTGQPDLADLCGAHSRRSNTARPVYHLFGYRPPGALPRARTTRQIEPSSPPGAAGPHAAALHRSAAARVSRARPGTRAGRGLPADRGTRLMHEIIPYYAQRPAGIP